MDSTIQTEKLLRRLEARISRVYAKAYTEIEAEFLKDSKRYKEKSDKLREEGKLKELKQYQQYALISSEQAKDKIKYYSQVLTNTDELASAIINDDMPTIYAINYNDISPVIRKAMGDNDISLSVIRPETAKEILLNNSQLHWARVNVPQTMQWNVTRINDELLLGILKGDNPRTLARRLAIITNSNRAFAIRDARTMTTTAQNLGRNDRFEKGKEELAKHGFKVRKKWVATKDERTRPHHRMLDGTYANDDGYFMFNLRYPADWSCGNAGEVYNCRCTMVEVIEYD